METASRPVSEAVAVADLRWWLSADSSKGDDGRTLGAGEIPGRPTLRARWGWTDHRVRALLREEELWRDGWGVASASPADRQPVASASPAGRQRVASDDTVETEQKGPNRQRVASGPPADRQPVASASPARLHTRVGDIDMDNDTDMERDTNTPAPARGGERDEQLSLVPTPPARPRKPRKVSPPTCPPDVAERIWQAWLDRAPGVPRLRMVDSHRQLLAELMAAGWSEDDLRAVIAWSASDHGQAEFLRSKQLTSFGDVLKAEKLANRLEWASATQPPPATSTAIAPAEEPPRWDYLTEIRAHIEAKKAEEAAKRAEIIRKAEEGADDCPF